MGHGGRCLSFSFQAQGIFGGEVGGGDDSAVNWLPVTNSGDALDFVQKRGQLCALPGDCAGSCAGLRGPGQFCTARQEHVRSHALPSS